MYPANIYKIFIASPSDTIRERNIVSKIVAEWNRTYSDTRGIWLRDLRWENDAFSIDSKTAQDTINEQLLHDSDLLIAIFKNRIGSLTNNNQTGTLEEIKKHMDAGKPYALFFCNAKITRNQSEEEREQLSRLETFKLTCQELRCEYKNSKDFEDKFRERFNKISEKIFISQNNEYQVLNNKIQDYDIPIAGGL